MSLCTYSIQNYNSDLKLKRRHLSPSVFYQTDFIWPYCDLSASRDVSWSVSYSLNGFKMKYSGTGACLLWRFVTKSHGYDLVLVLERLSGYRSLEGQFFFIPISWIRNTIKNIRTYIPAYPLCLIGVKLSFWTAELIRCQFTCLQKIGCNFFLPSA